MTDDEVAAIGTLADAASAGPWEAYFNNHGDPYVMELGRRQFGTVVSTHPDDYGRANCEFIAASRSAVPALVAEVQRLRAALAASCMHPVSVGCPKCYESRSALS